MPTFEVTAPDGKVFEVNTPEGGTEQDAIRYLASTYTPEIPVKVPEEGILRQAADIPVGFARGAVQGVRFIADAFGADNPVSESLQGAEEYLGRLMSAQSKKDAEEISRIMEEAEDKGVLDQVLAGIKALSIAPVDLITQAFGTAAPALVGGLAGMGLRGAAVLSGGMGAGITKSAIKDAVKSELVKIGVSEEEAEARADLAQQYGGENLDQILLGTGLGAISGFTGIEAALIPSVVRNITTRALGKSAIAKAGQVALGEAVPEFFQAGQEQVAGNIALQRQGFEVPTFQGALSQATLEGLVGGLLGAGVGAISPERAAPEAPPTPVTSPVTSPVQDQAAVDQFVQQYGQQAPVPPVQIPGVETPPTGLTPADFMTPEQVRLQRQQQAAQQFGLEQPTAPTIEPDRVARQQQAAAQFGLAPPIGAPMAAPQAPSLAEVTAAQTPVRTPTAPLVGEEGRSAVEAINAQAEDRRATIERLRQQAETDPTERGRQIARETLGEMLRTPAQPRLVDPQPMDLRTATTRLNFLKAQSPTADLNVVPHPSVPNAFAIEERPAAPLEPEAAPARPQPDLEAQQRIEAAAMAGRPRGAEEEARQVILTRALQNIQERGGVASPEEARIIQEANLGQPYDRIDYGLSPQGTVDQRLTAATGIDLLGRPREAVTEPARMAEGQRQALQEETERRAQAAPEVDSVISALSKPAFARSAEETSTARIASQRYAPEDVRLMEQAATDPDSLTEEGQRRLNNIREFGPRFSLSDQVSPETQALADDVRTKLLPLLKKFGMEEVGLRLMDSIEGGTANGSYLKQIITIALDSDNPVRVFRHETIHALKQLGAFTAAEWKALRKRARDEWIGRFLGDEMVQRYRDIYAEQNNGDMTGFDEYIEEEAIADAFSYFESPTKQAGDKPPAGMIANLIRRLKNMFKAIKDFFTDRSLNAENIFLTNQIFQDIEQGRMTRRGAAEERDPVFSARSPLEEYVSPEDAEGRIRRREARAPGVGAPTNARKVFQSKGVDFPVGKITTTDWLNRVQSLMSEEEIQDSRVWYQQLNDALTPLFGKQAPEYALAWLLSQKRASPTKGLLDVLRASDIAKGKQKILGAGLNEQAIIDVLSGKMPEGGVGAKLLDFVDSELGLPTRTVVRGDPRGRQPAAIDVWAQRDIGFIDNTVLEFIEKKFGKKAAESIEIDKATSGEAQYEYGIDFYNDVVDMLNAQNFMGGGWTAREVQAVGWVTMQRAMGIQAQFVRDIIGGNTRRISIGLAPGEGSVMTGKLMGKEIPPMAAKRVVKELADIANVRISKNIAGVGAYLQYTEGSIQVDALASPEAVADLMDMIGYVFQQTEVINTRALKSGKNMAIDILSPKLKSINDATRFFAEFLTNSPKDKDGDPIAPGFQQIEIDGQPGIRLLNFSGKWRGNQVEAIREALKAASDSTKIGVKDIVVSNVEMKSTKNDWSKEHDGISYLDSLRNRGRLQEAELLQRRFPPSRFDLAGDGTIGWGGKRYSLRPTKSAFRPSPSSDGGIAFGDVQPDAKTFVGSHYGKAKVPVLSANQYGTGLRGAEARRLDQSYDPRIKKRVYFYIPDSNDVMPEPEAGVGSNVYSQTFKNILAPGETMSRLSREARGDSNDFESAVIDAGYDGYAVPDYGMMVILNNDVPVKYEGTVSELAQEPKAKFSLRPEQKAVTKTEPFKRWFRKSKVVDEQGNPKIMYHGTARDIEEFRAKQAGAIFVTEDPRFAESFGDMSETYMIDEYFNGLNDAEKSSIIQQAIKATKQSVANMVKNKEVDRRYQSDMNDVIKDIESTISIPDLTFSAIPGPIEEQAIEILKDRLQSRANIIPLYVRAERPFDYANMDHINEIAADLYDEEVAQIRNGSWRIIEQPHVQRAIREAGFDGFYILEAGRKNLAVYDPNQVKSATGNIGTFDDTGRIRYNLAEKPANAPPQLLTKATPVVSAGKAIQTAATDALDAVRDNDYWTKKRIEWVDRNSGLTQRLKSLPLYDPNGTLRADMLKHAQSQVLNLVKTGLASGTPFVNSDGTLSIQRSENNLARSEFLAERLNTNQNVIDSGLTGKQYVAEIARALRGMDIIEEDKRLNALGIQQMAEATNLMKEAKRVAGEGRMRDAQRIIARVKRLRKEGRKNKKSKRELQVTPDQIAWAQDQLRKTPEVQEILDIWKNINTSLVNLWEEVGLLSPEKAQEYRDNRNYVPLFKSREDLNDEKTFRLAGVGAKTTAKLKALEGSEAIRNIWENLDKQYAAMTAAAYENQTRRIAVQQLQALGAAERTNISDPRGNLKFKEGGQDINVIVENPNELLAFQSFSYELSPIMKAMGAMTRVLRAGALINPMFWLRQLIRDPIHATLVANSGVITPFHAAGNFIQEIAKSSPESRILAERGVIGPIDSTLDMNEFLTNAGRERMKNPNFAQKAIHRLLQVHEASDAATRVAIFKKAKEKALKDGLSEAQAIDLAVFKARESINFSVMGMHPMLNSLRQMIPFLNATIVGLDTLYKAATGYGLNPEERKEAMRQFRVRAGIMVAASLAYALMYSNDDDYNALPNYVKDNNFLIPIGTGEERNFIKLAIPYEVGFLFKTVPEIAVRYLKGNDTGKEMMASLLGGLIHNLPTGGVPIPQAVRPGLEVVTNYSFFTGRPIEGMSDQGLPTEFRGDKASEFAKVLSRLGLKNLNLSPVEIDYLTQGYFAELGTFTTDMASSLLAYGQGKEPPAKNLEEQPFFKSFLTNPNSDRAVANFYEITQTAQEVSRAFNDLAKLGQGEEAAAYLGEDENRMLIGAASSMRKIRDQMSEIRQQIRIIRASQTMSPEEKREYTNQLQETFNRLAQQGVSLADQLGLR